MHEYFQMPGPANIAYVAYCVVCIGYGAFVLAASLFVPQYRHRVHRGSWLHVAEGWAVAAVLWAACVWARHEVVRAAASWSGRSPTPTGVGVPSIAFWILAPPALTVSFVMLVTTIVRSIPTAAARP